MMKIIKSGKVKVLRVIDWQLYRLKDGEVLQPISCNGLGPISQDLQQLMKKENYQNFTKFVTI